MTLQLLGLHRKVGPTLPIRKVLDSCEKTRKPSWLWFDIFFLGLIFFFRFDYLQDCFIFLLSERLFSSLLLTEAPKPIRRLVDNCKKGTQLILILKDTQRHIKKLTWASWMMSRGRVEPGLIRWQNHPHGRSQGLHTLFQRHKLAMGGYYNIIQHKLVMGGYYKII